MGQEGSEPQAPTVTEGAVNGDDFEWSVRELLCPALTPGQLLSYSPYRETRTGSFSLFLA